MSTSGVHGGLRVDTGHSLPGALRQHSGEATTAEKMESFAKKTNGSTMVREAPRKRSSASRMAALLTPTVMKAMWDRDLSMNRWTLRFLDPFVEGQYQTWCMETNGYTKLWAASVFSHAVASLLLDVLVLHDNLDNTPDTMWLILRVAAVLVFVMGISALMAPLCRVKVAGRVKTSHAHLAAYSVPLAGCCCGVYGALTTLARDGLFEPDLSLFRPAPMLVSAGDVVCIFMLLALPSLSPLEFLPNIIAVGMTLAAYCAMVLCAASGSGTWVIGGIARTDSVLSNAALTTLLPVGVSAVAILCASYRHSVKQRDRFAGCWWDVHDARSSSRSDHDPETALVQLTHTVKTGKLRSLMVKALGRDGDEAVSAKGQLRSFMDKARTLLSQGGLGSGDSRYNGLLTAANAVSVADQWLDRVRQIETGGFEGDDGCQVFLGGSCNPTTWRRDTAIPALSKAGITYYNPQVEEWTPDLIDLETTAKHKSACLFFVIDGVTRAIVSMNEVTELICRGRTVVLVVQNVAAGQDIGGQTLSQREVKDLNRGRAYLLDLAHRYAVPTFDSVEKGLDAVTAMFRSQYRGNNSNKSGEGGGSGLDSVFAATTSGSTPTPRFKRPLRPKLNASDADHKGE